MENELEGNLGYKGERGYSAYELAVQHGYQGTEEQWCEDFTNAENFYDKTEMDTKLTDYVPKSDIVDNLTSTDSNKPLSAKQGKELKDELSNYQPKILSGTANPSGGNDGDIYFQYET